MGLLAHRLAGEEPLATEPEYVAHLVSEALIVLFAALIAWWLIDDVRTARRRRQGRLTNSKEPLA
ncbi:MAG: hypothetical protein IRZ14_04630 [Chloroflexi bacterium]|nr:hypothetical protein [Chloroflexota bacterium]